jgi:hypothetical protein
MSKGKPSSKIDGLFVPLLIEIQDAPAWRATGHGARSLYMALRRHYNSTIENNGKIYLPQRVAQKELGSSGRTEIVRWFRELQFYGFIVMTSAGYLGVNGHGRAPCWRLTELPCKGEPATKDYLAWAGAKFADPKKSPVQKPGPSRSRNQDQGTKILQ